MHERRYFIAGTAFEAPPLPAGLHIVATPIGNLRDITLRALEVLAAADVVFCEDTRTSGKLLEHYGITTPRKALHEHNERALVDAILDDLRRGGTLALISDAGTPLLSDPGFPLVRAAREAGLTLFAVPGASALLGALMVAGLPTDAFGFAGFLPSKAEARDTALRALAGRRDTLAFYESPRRLGDALGAMARIFGGERPAAIALELTKKFERVFRGPLADLAAQFAAAETRGEAVILVAGAPETVADETEWRAALEQAMLAQPLRAAVDEIAARYLLKRKDVYDAALALKADDYSFRRFAEGAGRLGEFWASLLLQLKLYRILERRVRTPVGEIDLIVERFGVTVFVEVKSRSFTSQEAEALGAVNRRRIVRAAQSWLALHPALIDSDLRFDVIFLAPLAWPRHIVNAFDATGL